MNTKIKIAHLPLDIAWCDCEENLLAVADKLPSIHPDTDILVLPELFSTGFIQDESLLKNVAHTSAQMTMAAVHLWSKRFNMAIAGSFLTDVGSKYYNRGFFIEPSGEETFYDKRHLFSLSAESSIFSPGEQLPPVVRFRGWNISLVVCYDLRFPVWCRNRGQRYDVLLVPANWASSRGYAWKQLLIARAIENQAVVVGANRSGHDDYGDYEGESFIFDPFGKLLAPVTEKSTDGVGAASEDSATAGKAGSPFIYAEYTREDLQRVRDYLPVGKDADDFSLLLHRD